MICWFSCAAEDTVGTAGLQLELSFAILAVIYSQNVDAWIVQMWFECPFN